MTRNISNNNAKIIQYGNQLNQVILGTLTAKEIDIFHSICYKVQNQGTGTIEILFKELRELSEFRNRNKERLLQSIDSLTKKLNHLEWYVEEGQPGERIITRGIIFTTFKTLEKEEKVLIEVNKEYLKYFNDLNKNFTEINLYHVNNLISKFAKIEYRDIMAHQKDGQLIEDYNHFIIKMNAKNLSNSDVDKGIITPIKKELSPFLPNFNIIKIKNGRKTEKLHISWDNHQSQNKTDNYFKNILKKLGLDYNPSLKDKINDLVEEKGFKQIEDWINEAWTLITKNPKAKSKPGYLYKIICNVGLEKYVTDRKEMEHNIKSNKKSAQREKEWEQEKNNYANIDNEREGFKNYFYSLPINNQEKWLNLANLEWEKRTGQKLIITRKRENDMEGTGDFYGVVIEAALFPVVKNLIEEGGIVNEK